jgi:sugar/nucleoside kinase (ribokinase family)
VTVAIRVTMVGEVGLDDIVVEGGPAMWRQPGGGALYSALGALIWGAHPTICAAVGETFPDELLERIAGAGIDVSGVTRVPGDGFSQWLLYEADGFRRQVPKANGAALEDLDGAREPWEGCSTGVVDGVHVAPQSVSAQAEAIASAAERGVLATLDLMVEPQIDVDAYRSGDVARGAAALLPNDVEVRQIWGDRPLDELFALLRERAGLTCLVVKRGSEGARVVFDGEVVDVPAVSSACVDPTGAGDAFCGGFLTGLIETGDPVEAALRGAVSASFAVEGQGAEPLLTPVDEGEVTSRLASARQQMRRAA